MESDLDDEQANATYPARSIGVPVFVMMPLDTVCFIFLLCIFGPRLSLQSEFHTTHSTPLPIVLRKLHI